jgi:hypothetical protein
VTGIEGDAPWAGVLTAPSVLTADFADLRSELARIANADFAHVDVMDNTSSPTSRSDCPSSSGSSRRARSRSTHTS